MKAYIQQELRRHLPAVWQWRAYHKYLHAPYGEREIHLLSKIVDPERIAVDVGVHEGIYSRHLAGLCRGVVGFDANPLSAAFCQAALGRLATIHNCALSDAAGTVTLRIPMPDGRGGETALATIAPSNVLGGRPAAEVTVRAARLDDFDLPPVGFIKIDVEGHEEAVLRGAQGVIARDRPVLMIEIEERHNPGALGRIFQSLRVDGFTAACMQSGALRDAGDAKAFAARAPGEPGYVHNFFFFPAERSPSLPS